jgi:hypothetical protein
MTDKEVEKLIPNTRSSGRVTEHLPNVQHMYCRLDRDVLSMNATVTTLGCARLDIATSELFRIQVL